MRSIKVPLTTALLVLACGGDGGPMGPSGPADIEGTWSYSAGELSGNGFHCHTPGSAQLVLTQEGNTFTGTYEELHLHCERDGQTAHDGPFTGFVVSGSVIGEDVSFNFDTSSFSHGGTISGNAMSGTTTWDFRFGGQVIRLTGDWSASR